MKYWKSIHSIIKYSVISGPEILDTTPLCLVGDLNGCPLCKSKCHIDEVGRFVRARCPDCGCTSDLMQNKEDLKQHWNTRANGL